MSTAHANAEEYSAHGHKDHGHVIVSIWTLRLVLAALLFFTLATVGASAFEAWIAHVFNVEIPQWINASVALSIAVVKTTLVVLFFMQLKYDNPLNGMIFIFTLMTVAFFLGFTTLDLGKRATLDPRKAAYIIPGGTGLKNEGVPITKTAEVTAKANGEFHADHAHPPHPNRGSITNAGFYSAEPAAGSSPNRARPVSGLTLPGFAPAKPDDGHGHGDQAPEPAPTAAPGH